MINPHESKKLHVLGRLKAGATPKDLVAEMQIPYGTIRRWEAELQLINTNESIANLVNTETLVLDSIADQVIADLSLDIPVGEAETIVKGVVEGVHGLQALDVELQSAATHLAKRISQAAIAANDPKTMTLLADALSKLQLSFFAKGTNINVLNAPNARIDDKMGKFQALQRDS